MQGDLIRVTGEQDEDGNFIYDNLPEYKYIDIEFVLQIYSKKCNPKAEKTKVGKIICRWAQFPETKGIMPSILEELLKARKDTRKMIKTEKDPFMQNILDKRLGYKVTANSLMVSVVHAHQHSMKDVAASPQQQESMIVYAKRIIEEVYGNEIVDTKNDGKVRTRAEYIAGYDSVFFTFNLEHPDTGERYGQKALELTIEIAQEAANLCTQFLKPPQCLEYEKTNAIYIAFKETLCWYVI